MPLDACFVIHFDTNALISLPQWAQEGRDIVQRVVDGESVAVCAVVWHEFLIGPLVDDEAELAHAFISGRIEPVSEADAELGARLFNVAGRRRSLKTDALKPSICRLRHYLHWQPVWSRNRLGQ